MINNSGYFHTDETGTADLQHAISVNSAGRYKLITRQYFDTLRSQGRDDFQLIYVASGSADFQINGVFHHLKEGHVILYYPHHRQQYRYQLKNQPDVYWLHFSGREAGDWALRAGFSSSGFCQTGLHSEFALLFGKIIQEAQLKKSRCHALSALYTQEILELLIRYGRSQQNASFHSSELVEKAVIDFHQSYQQPFQIREYAAKHNVSACWFIRCFKQQTGSTPQRYLTDIRMAKAKELLFSSTLTCSEIALEVGYPDPLYFSRVFRRETGMSPQTFRQRMREDA